LHFLPISDHRCQTKSQSWNIIRRPSIQSVSEPKEIVLRTDVA